jgi:hypothetical protein
MYFSYLVYTRVKIREKYLLCAMEEASTYGTSPGFTAQQPRRQQSSKYLLLVGMFSGVLNSQL